MITPTSPRDARYCYVVVSSSSSECNGLAVTTCNKFYSIKDVNQYLLNWKYRTNDKNVAAQVYVFHNGQAMNLPFVTCYLVSASSIDVDAFLVLWHAVEFPSNEHASLIKAYQDHLYPGLSSQRPKAEGDMFEFHYNVSHKSHFK